MEMVRYFPLDLRFNRAAILSDVKHVIFALVSKEYPTPPASQARFRLVNLPGTHCGFH